MSDEPLVPVPIPALINMLSALERKKGTPLTRDEVEQARDQAICMVMRISDRDALYEKRGYSALDLENVWEDWLAFRSATQT